MVQPHEKTMKVQWIEVDGRSVPLVLPQYWDNELEEWIVTGTDNPLQVDARLIGGKVEQVIERGIYTTTPRKSLNKPYGAKGLLVSVRVYGATGNFGEMEGFLVQVKPYSGNFIFINRLRTAVINAPTRGGLLFYPGSQIGESVELNNFLAIAPYPITEIVELEFGITGTFDTGEGIDYEVLATWLI